MSGRLNLGGLGVWAFEVSRFGVSGRVNLGGLGVWAFEFLRFGVSGRLNLEEVLGFGRLNFRGLGCLGV